MSEIEDKMMLHNAVERVCNVLGDVTTEEIMSKKRTHHVATARQLVYWYLWYICKRTFSEIGRMIEKHHATIGYGVEQIDIMISQNRTKEDRRIVEAVEELRKQ